MPILEWQKAELERRRREYLQNPDVVIPWSEVKRAILASAHEGTIEPKETEEDAG